MHFDGSFGGNIWKKNGVCDLLAGQIDRSHDISLYTDEKYTTLKSQKVLKFKRLKKSCIPNRPQVIMSQDQHLQLHHQLLEWAWWSWGQKRPTRNCPSQTKALHHLQPKTWSKRPKLYQECQRSNQWKPEMTKNKTGYLAKAVPKRPLKDLVYATWRLKSRMEAT